MGKKKIDFMAVIKVLNLCINVIRVLIIFLHN